MPSFRQRGDNRRVRICSGRHKDVLDAVSILPIDELQKRRREKHVGESFLSLQPSRCGLRGQPLFYSVGDFRFKQHIDAAKHAVCKFLVILYSQFRGEAP